MTQLTEEQIAARRNGGLWMSILGGILLFLGIYVSAFLIPDVIRSASGPQTMTLEKAALVANSDQTYARIEDGKWDCETLTHVRGLSPSYRSYASMREETKYTEIFFTNQQIILFVTLSGEVDCGELDEKAPEGYLYAMNSDTQQELTNEARLARYIKGDTYLEMCGYCGRENSLIGAVFGVVFTVGGAVLLVVGRRLRRTPNE